LHYKKQGTLQSSGDALSVFTDSELFLETAQTPLEKSERIKSRETDSSKEMSEIVSYLTIRSNSDSRIWG
jgi:hypothetical protein